MQTANATVYLIDGVLSPPMGLIHRLIRPTKAGSTPSLPGLRPVRARPREVAAARLRAMGEPQVGVIMGSRSDWETMKAAAETLEELGVRYETRVVSAHRTPDLLFEYAASAADRGLQVIVAGAGGAAHLPGMAAAKTHLPVLGVPVESKALKGMDSLLSIAQMPAGVPVGTLAIGRAGAVNAALLAAASSRSATTRSASVCSEFRADADAEPCSRTPTPPTVKLGESDRRRRPARAHARARRPPARIRFRMLDPSRDSPAGQVATEHRGRLRRPGARSRVSPTAPAS